MIYILAISTCILFLYLSLKFDKIKFLHYLFLIISFSIPCTIAGLRDYKIGGDVNLYIYPLFLKAKQTNIIDFIFKNIFMKDYLYLFITYICANILNSMFWMFYIIDFFILFSIFKALKMLFKSNGAIIIGIFIALTVLYNASFNMARQSMSLASSILAIAYLIRNDKRKFLLTFIVSLLIHWSSFIILFIYMLYLFMMNSKISDNKKMIIIFEIAIICLFLIFTIPKLNIILEMLDLTKIRLYKYLDSFVTETFTSNTTADTLFFVGILFIILITKKQLYDKYYMFFLSCCIIGIVVMQFGSFIKYGFRLSYYFLYPILILELPKLTEKGKKRINKVILYSIFSFYWYFWTIIANYHGTIPYLFK